MDHNFNFITEKIRHRLIILEKNLFRETMSLQSWYYHEINQPVIDHDKIPNDESTGWLEIKPHSYWGDWKTNFVLKLDFQIPREWDTSTPSQLYLPFGEAGDFFSHPEMLITCNSERIGSSDRHHHVVPLPLSLKPGESVKLVTSGWTGHSSWPPEPGLATKLYMRPCCLIKRDEDVFNFINLARSALETSELEIIAEHTKAKFLDVLNDAFLEIDWAEPLSSDSYFKSVSLAYSKLQRSLPLVGDKLHKTIHAIGHAHIDLAYLWRMNQTDGKLLRTFTNVVKMMEADADFMFTQTTPYLYERCAEISPDLFEQIKQYVQQGLWEAATQTWVEMDCNLVGGESLINQLQLAQDFNEKHFSGAASKVLFLPDTFGFCGSLPQLLQQAGIEAFVCSKLNWNQYNKFPHSFFNWRGIDGSEIFSHLLTTPRDVAYLPTPSTYKAEMTAYEVRGSSDNCSEKDAPVMIAYGYGDGGGGPNDILLSSAKAFKNMPAQPKLQHSRLDTFMADAKRNISNVPVHVGELYLELHRGTYTSQAKIKRYNRKLENKLLKAEAITALVAWHTDTIVSDIQLNDLWKKYCLNQFHDILPGTAITEVFDDALKDYAEIDQLLNELIASALLEFKSDQGGQLKNVLKYHPFEGWYTERFETFNEKNRFDSDYVVPFMQDNLVVLENELIRVEICKDASIKRIRHKDFGDLIAPDNLANIFKAYVDRPLMWDAWDIDPSYHEQHETLNSNSNSKVLVNTCDDGVLITIEWKECSIQQKIQLSIETDNIRFKTKIDWHQKNTLLKVEFPISISSDLARYHIPFGFIDRTTNREDKIGRAQYEVPAHFWAAIFDDDRGFALINDCKYGYSIDQTSYGNKLAISLIKSAVFPDPVADQGFHEFEYVIVPFEKNNQQKIWEKSYEINRSSEIKGEGISFPEQILPLSGNDNLILEGIFWSQKSCSLVARFFEPFGKSAWIELNVDNAIPYVIKSDILEKSELSLVPQNGKITFNVRPFEVITLLIPKRRQFEDVF